MLKWEDRLPREVNRIDLYAVDLSRYCLVNFANNIAGQLVSITTLAAMYSRADKCRIVQLLTHAPNFA